MRQTLIIRPTCFANSICSYDGMELLFTKLTAAKTEQESPKSTLDNEGPTVFSNYHFWSPFVRYSVIFRGFDVINNDDKY